MTELDLSAITGVFDALFPKVPRPLPLHEPYFGGNEWEYVKGCLDTGWVSSAGKYVDQFEKKLIDYTGAKFAVAVVNGTAALHVCLLLAGVKKGDEVLVPTLTFIATANAVTYCGATPHLVDVTENTLGVNPEKLGSYLSEVSVLNARGCFNKYTGARIKALVPMHTFGHPVDLDLLSELCSQYQIELVEDAAESLGSLYKGNHTGTIGIAGAISFNGNKIVTTGGGGAILTNNLSLANRAKHITTTARIPHRWSFTHDESGFNYRLPNLNAALGCAQLEQLPDFIETKRALANRYEAAFSKITGLKLFAEASFAKSNYWLNALILNQANESVRNKLLDHLNSAEIVSRPVWTLMHHLKMFESCPKMDLNIAESLEKRIVNIPSSACLGNKSL